MKYLLMGLSPVLLLVVFIALKLFDVIAWSWWWVFAPLWVTFILIVLLAIYIVHTLKNEDLDVSDY